MLNLPKIDYDMPENPTDSNFLVPPEQETKLCRVVMQTLATQVIRYMALRGSNMSLFTAQPSAVQDTEERPKKDANGHQWPEYFYTKGRHFDTRGQSEIIAVPVSNALLEMPESEVLFYGL
jgi:hypothetical protein